MRLKFAFEPIIGGVWGDEPKGDSNDMVCVRVADFNDLAGTVSTDKLTQRNISPSEQRGRVLHCGDLLLEKSGGGEQTAVGRSVRFNHDFKAVSSNFIALLRPRKGFDANYLSYLMRAKYQEGGSIPHIKQTTGIQNLDCSSYLGQDFNFPAPEKQRQIAAYLDAVAGKIDRLVALRRRQMELLREQRAALIQQAVTRGLDSNVPLKESGLPWLGKIPGHWEVVRTKYVARLESGHTPSRQHPEWWVYCTIPWVSLADIGQFREGQIEHITGTSENISELGLSNSSARLLPAGTVLVSRTASVGFSVVAGVPLATTQDFVNWVCGRRLLPEYLLYVFRIMRQEFNRLTSGSTHQTIYMPDVSNFVTPLPPIDEQRAIYSHIKAMLPKVDASISAYSRQIELLEEYRAALIHEAVTGQKAVLEEGVSAETGREANVHFRRSVLGAEIIHRLHDDAKFGRVKLEKLLYLSEAFAGMDLQGHYLRAAAGPFDNFALRSVESQIQRQGWYRSVKEDKRTRYVPLAKAGGHQTYFAEYWQEQKPKFEQLMELLRPATTQQCEIVATLFAAWNDRLAAGQKSDDDDLVDEVLKNWHPDKQKIERERWLNALEWMREHGLVPEGTCVITHGKSKGTGQRLVPEASADRAGNDP